MSSANQFKKVYSLFENALNSSIYQLSPSFCVQNSLKLTTNRTILEVKNEKYDLIGKRIHIIAAGKAAISMVHGAEAALTDRIVDGIASVPFGSVLPPSKIKFYPGAKNNLPDAAAVRTVEKVENYVKNLDSNDLLLFLISGGGSALLPAPVEGVTLEEKLKVTKLLASTGATIQELNTVRIALSRIKGGKLSQKFPGKSISLIISDIVGDPANLIASGPTVAQNVPNSKALDILKARCWNDTPESVKAVLSAPDVQQSTHSTTQNVIVLSNKFLVETVVQNIQKQVLDIPLEVQIASTNFEGDATESGNFFAENVMYNSTQMPQHWTLRIYAGETTVNFPSPFPQQTKGGRNQELALAFLQKLVEYRLSSESSKNAFFGIACIGTDGQDGPTDAAGAVVSDADLESLSTSDLRLLRDEITTHLAAKTSYNFWNSFNSGKNHLKFGKTGHNLMDIYAVFFKL